MFMTRPPWCRADVAQQFEFRSLSREIRASRRGCRGLAVASR